MLSNVNDMQKPFYKKVLAFNRQQNMNKWDLLYKFFYKCIYFLTVDKFILDSCLRA